MCYKRGESTLRERGGLKEGKGLQKSWRKNYLRQAKHGCEGNTVTLGKLEWSNWGFLYLFIFCSFIRLFWPHHAACKILPGILTLHARSLTRDGTSAPYSGSLES